VQELAPGLWRWTARHPEWHPGEFGARVGSYAVHDREGTILVDPLVAGDEAAILDALDDLVRGHLRIVITIPYHVRSAELLWRRYHQRREAGIWGHRLAARRVAAGTAFRAVEPGDVLPGGIRAHGIGFPRPRAEQPLELPSHRALALGDAIVEVGGELRVWQATPDTDRKRAWYAERLLPTFRPLAELDVDRVLVTHGEPVLSGGRAALARAFERPPWNRALAARERRAAAGPSSAASP
jgi:glyoxylase-like metal-dependent hydrolase (beta-lactamase superfamily II)